MHIQIRIETAFVAETARDNTAHHTRSMNLLRENWKYSGAPSTRSETSCMLPQRVKEGLP